VSNSRGSSTPGSPRMLPAHKRSSSYLGFAIYTQDPEHSTGVRRAGIVMLSSTPVGKAEHSVHELREDEL
jgi:hypothetical protein